jgi:hypothetical protein
MEFLLYDRTDHHPKPAKFLRLVISRELAPIDVDWPSSCLWPPLLLRTKLVLSGVTPGTATSRRSPIICLSMRLFDWSNL